jgi:hypothetical protein
VPEDHGRIHYFVGPVDHGRDILDERKTSTLLALRRVELILVHVLALASLGQKLRCRRSFALEYCKQFRVSPGREETISVSSTATRTGAHRTPINVSLMHLRRAGGDAGVTRPF